MQEGLTYRPGADLEETVLLMQHAGQDERPRMSRFLERNPSYDMELWFWSDRET